MNKEPDLTPQRVREFLDYDPETGILSWRKRDSARDLLRLVRRNQFDGTVRFWLVEKGK